MNKSESSSPEEEKSEKLRPCGKLRMEPKGAYARYNSVEIFLSKNATES